MSVLIWVHEEMLNRDHPAFTVAGSDAEAIFIWDDAYFRDQNYSLKRLVFIYENLIDMNVTLYKGDTKAVLETVSQGQEIYTGVTPNPYFNDVLNALADRVKVTSVKMTPLTAIAANSDMGRFFRYWNRARKSALSYNGVVSS